MSRSYVNQEGSGTVYSSGSQGKTDYEVITNRLMMIAERLVALEQRVTAIEAKTK